MKKYHLTISLFISALLHSLLLLFFIRSDLKNFKKGTGENPKIKISSINVISPDSQSQITAQSPPPKQTTNHQSQKKLEKKITKKEKAPLKQESITQTEHIPQVEDPPQTYEEVLDDPLMALNQNLFNLAPKNLPIEERLSYQLADPQTKRDIHQFYGAEFGQFGLEEQEYILNNLAQIGRITQRYLRYPPNAGMLSQSGRNVLEFYLHPNGDISDLRIIQQSGFILLDRNSIKTIEIAYKDYPHPKTKTLIRFRIDYYLR